MSQDKPQIRIIRSEVGKSDVSTTVTGFTRPVVVISPEEIARLRAVEHTLWQVLRYSCPNYKEKDCYIHCGKHSENCLMEALGVHEVLRKNEV